MHVGDYHYGFDTATEQISLYMYDGAGWVPLGNMSRTIPGTSTTVGTGSSTTTTWTGGRSGSVSTWTTGGVVGAYTPTGVMGTTAPTHVDPTLFDVDVDESAYEILYPEKEDPDAFPSRAQFIARTIREHRISFKMITVDALIRTPEPFFRCSCEKMALDSKIWELHIAEVAAEASDEWDELLMGPDMEDEG